MEHVQLDAFTLPLHTLLGNMRKSLNQLLETFKSQFAQDETSIDTTHLTRMQIDTGNLDPVLKRPYPITMKHYDWVKNEIKTPGCVCNLQQPLQLVSTYHHGTQG